MKHTLLCACAAALLACSSAYSQVNQGDWELSLSGTLGSISSSYEYTSPAYSMSGDPKAQGFVSLALRPGYYLTEGLEIEPEIYWTAIEEVKPAFCLTANLAYNFNITGSRAVPFIIAGAGKANAVPIFQRLIPGSGSDGLDIGVLNAGGGVKLFVSERIAFRAEYRYQHYEQESSGGTGIFQYTLKQKNSFHNVLLGLSFFLR